MDPSPLAATSSRSNPKQSRKPASSRPPVPKPAGKLRGLPKDPEDVRISKTLSYLLRHGAKSEGLFMRPDGYVKVEDLLALPRLSSLSLGKLEKIVQDDAKKRYNLAFEPAAEGSVAGVWLIRANQGHSLRDVDLQHSELTDARQVPMAVHGTTVQAWKSIATQGLSKMTRQHIHLAQGVAGDGVISGMRKSSQVLIYIDLESALRSGLKFYVSQNGVVLTPGDERGFLAPEFFTKVEGANGEPMSGWTRPQRSDTRIETEVLAGGVEELSIDEKDAKAHSESNNT